MLGSILAKKLAELVNKAGKCVIVHMIYHRPTRLVIISGFPDYLSGGGLALRYDRTCFHNLNRY